MFYVLGIITSDLCFCSWESLSLTVVTEAAGEQSTSDIFVYCMPGNKGVNHKSKKVYLSFYTTSVLAPHTGDLIV